MSFQIKIMLYISDIYGILSKGGDMTQDQRLDYLLEKFKEDSVRYMNLRVGESAEDKRMALRSLMNIRMPGLMDEKTLEIQDEYLSARIREKGIVSLDSIPGAADKISIWQGDITLLAVDAIVNAANSQMLGCFVPMHTCIDNCIHTFAGIQLRWECHQKMEELRSVHGQSYQQPTSVPMLTEGYNLPAKKVIHVVGPIVQGQLAASHEKALADCYSNVLDMCLVNGLRSVAFCCISTGVFHFPNQRAAEISTETVKSWLKGHPEAMDRVIFNVFKDNDRRLYEQLL
jgi:O-acetyl-ADP-ribose deacetylase (regulator of RNase III)